MSGIRRRAIHKRLVANCTHLTAKVEEAANLLRPVYECDPKVREWLGHQGYGGDALTPHGIANLKAPVKGTP